MPGELSSAWLGLRRARPPDEPNRGPAGLLRLLVLLQFPTGFCLSIAALLGAWASDLPLALLLLFMVGTLLLVSHVPALTMWILNLVMRVR